MFLPDGMMAWPKMNCAVSDMEMRPEARRNETASVCTGTEVKHFRSSASCSATGDADACSDLTADWKKWKRHLHRRRRLKSLRKFVGGRRSMLHWNWLTDQNSDLGNRLLVLLDHRGGKRAASRESLRDAAQAVARRS